MRLTNMPTKKTHKTAKKVKAAVKKDDKVTRYLHASGIIMMISSVFMVTLPALYSKLYTLMVNEAGMAPVDWLMKNIVSVGIIIALLYCLLGVFVFRAGEHDTRLASGMSVFNSAMAVLAIAAIILIFLPVPEATFEYMMAYLVTANAQAGVFPMFVMMLVDAALLVGMLCSVAILDDMCLVKDKKK